MGDVMRAKSIAKYTALLSLALVIVFAAMSLIDATPALAHCDGLDGPVVGAARMALQTADLNRVLIWVRPDDISEIRRAFDEALAIRRLGPQAQELADRYFFETLVRGRRHRWTQVHRELRDFHPLCRGFVQGGRPAGRRPSA
jgi:hypothetical protein